MNPDQLYCAIPFSSFPQVDGNTYIHDLLTDRIVRLHETEMQFLFSLREFGSKVDHITNLEQRGLFAEDHQGLVALWNNLVQKKLLISAREFMSFIQKSESKAEQTPLSLIACLTADRPQLVIRMLNDYLTLAQKKEQSFSAVIYDTSQSQSAVTQLQEFLKAQTGLPSLHLTWDKALLFTAHLASTLVLDVEAKKALCFGILGEGFKGVTYGAGRNLMLLLTAGKRFLFSDDDTRPLTACYNHKENKGLALNPHSNPGRFAWFPDRSTLEKGLKKIEFDILAAHGQFVGAPLGQLLMQYGEDVQLRLCRRTLLYDLLKRPRQVLVSQAGSYGDCGMSTANGFFFLDQVDHRDSLKNQRLYDRLKLSREIIRQAETAAICQGPFFMALHAGIDNSNLLPPFPPLFRAEDSIWGILVRLTRPEALFAHLPFSILHDPPERHFTPSDFGSFSLRVSDYLQIAIEHFPQTNSEQKPDQILKSLGRFLADLGNMKEADFISCILPWLVNSINNHITAVIPLLHTPAGNFNWWRKDVNRYLQNIQDCLTSNILFIPEEFKNSEEHPAALKNLQEYLRLFGQFMMLWPDIYAVCRSPDFRLP